MPIECTIRFTDYKASAQRVFASVLTKDEAFTTQGCSGGFTFKSNRTAAAILVDLANDGFEDCDFDSIDFKFNT
jgi:hypothetical protein